MPPRRRRTLLSELEQMIANNPLPRPFVDHTVSFTQHIGLTTENSRSKSRGVYTTSDIVRKSLRYSVSDDDRAHIEFSPHEINANIQRYLDKLQKYEGMKDAPESYQLLVWFKNPIMHPLKHQEMIIDFDGDFGKYFMLGSTLMVSILPGIKINIHDYAQIIKEMLPEETHPLFDIKFNEYLRTLYTRISGECQSRFTNISKTFSHYASLMARICNSATTLTVCKKSKLTRKNVATICRRRFRPDSPKILINADVDNKLYSIFEKYLSYGNYKDFFNQSAERGFDVMLYKDGIREHSSGPGVARDTFSDLVREIKEKQLFVPSEEGSTRYLINPNFEFNYEFIDKGLYRRFSIEGLIALLYRMVGEYVAFCIVNNITLPFNLGYTLLYSLLEQKDFNQDKMVGLYFLDFPIDSNSMIALMRDPKMIKILNTNFNDYFPLKDDDDDKLLTIQNFKEYLRLKAYYMVSHKFHADIHTRDTYQYFIAFQAGFNSFNICQYLSSENVSVYMLDVLLSSYEVTRELVSEFISKLRFPNIDSSSNPIVGWFEEMLNTRGVGNIDQVINDDEHFDFDNFFKKLVAFFSGTPKVNINQRYYVHIIPTMMYPKLPTSSTCTYSIKVPKYLQENKKEFYSKLYQAVMYVGRTIDND